MLSNDDINYCHLRSALMEVNKQKIQIEKDNAQRSVAICEKMVKFVCRKLEKSDCPFKTSTNGVTYRGSYYSGVKIKAADEFDIDLQIKLPKMDNIRITNTEPGFIAINIKKSFDDMRKIPNWYMKYGYLEKFMDEEGYLLETKFREKFESFFSKSFYTGEIELDGTVIEINNILKLGPAFTFNLTCEDLKISIDFVFVLYFDRVHWPPSPVRMFTIPPKLQVQYSFWFAVPKPNGNKRSWRISFPKQENYYLDRAQHLKFCLKLLKALREAQNWNIASYHIQTLFLWESELVEINEDNEFWKKPIEKLFIYMLQKLTKALQEKEIKFFWDRRCNMIENVKEETCINMSNRIKGMLLKIKNKSNNKEELTDYVLKVMFRANL